MAIIQAVPRIRDVQSLWLLIIALPMIESNNFTDSRIWVVVAVVAVESNCYSIDYLANPWSLSNEFHCPVAESHRVTSLPTDTSMWLEGEKAMAVIPEYSRVRLRRPVFASHSLISLLDAVLLFWTPSTIHWPNIRWISHSPQDWLTIVLKSSPLWAPPISRKLSIIWTGRKSEVTNNVRIAAKYESRRERCHKPGPRN